MAEKIDIRLLGRFEIHVDGSVIDDASFDRRHAATLLKVLALTDERRMHREQVMDALWPELTVVDAAPRLHKAASYARKAVGDKAAIVLRDESVLLWPDANPEIDVHRFELAADLALSGSAAEAEAAADLYQGDLLLDDPYDDWAAPARDRLRLRYLDVLRVAGRWEEVLESEPADEGAHLALMRSFVAEGQQLSAMRQFERLERALGEELGVSPNDEAIALRERIVDDRAERARVELIDRTNEREVMQHALDDARRGAGSLILLTGVAGIGKTSLCEWLVDRAELAGCLVGRAVAASVDGPWPYAPVLEAVDDVLRKAPDLLDALPETHRDELSRVRDAPATVHEGPGDDNGHQRLFVAVDELVRLASEAHGLVLFVDDLHVADDASLALLHYLARQASRQHLLVVATARAGVDGDGLAPLRGLVGRHGARELRLGPFGANDAETLIRSFLDEEPAEATVERIMALSGGTPFYVEELAKASQSAELDALPDQLAAIVSASLAELSESLRDALARAAIAGSRFDTDEFIALSGVSEAAAFDLLDQALAAEVLVHTAGGYQFRHGLVREQLLEELPPHRRRVIHRDAAERFESMAAPPSRVAHHLIEAGDLAAAAPWGLRAAQAAQAVGALSDARALVEVVIEHSEAGTRLGLLALHGDLLAGIGDPGAVPAYQRALAETEGPMRRLLRAKMARAALMRGDIETAAGALDGLEPDGGPFDGPVLHAQGMLAYFTGDIDSAGKAADSARQFALGENASAQLLDVLTLQGMVAHNRGEWFERMRNELASTADSTELAATVFDCHL